MENQLELEDQLELIATSYDRGIDLGRKGISSYENFPSYITNHPNYSLLQQMDTSDSGRKEIVEYLAPKDGMKFIDLGCCLNLMFCGYKDWPSTYYGVDISSKTIDLLQEFVEKNNLIIGDLYCGSMHEIPYDTNFFDIGECIGSLEYFEKDFVQRAVVEFHRIIKPNGKFVLDIPNLGSPEFEISKLMEEYLGRADKFDLSIVEFETIIIIFLIYILCNIIAICSYGSKYENKQCDVAIVLGAALCFTEQEHFLLRSMLNYWEHIPIILLLKKRSGWSFFQK